MPYYHTQPPPVSKSAIAATVLVSFSLAIVALLTLWQILPESPKVRDARQDIEVMVWQADEKRMVDAAEVRDQRAADAAEIRKLRAQVEALNRGAITYGAPIQTMGGPNGQTIIVRPPTPKTE